MRAATIATSNGIFKKPYLSLLILSIATSFFLSFACTHLVWQIIHKIRTVDLIKKKKKNLQWRFLEKSTMVQ